MAIVGESKSDGKLSSTCDTSLSRGNSLSSLATLSRGNSIASLPETECGWPHFDNYLEAESSATHAALGCFLLAPAMPSVLAPGPPGQLDVPPRQPTDSVFRVAYQGGVEVRSGPFSAPLTGLLLRPDEVFSVAAELQGMDGIIYLCLADGRGWVFDDTELMPFDPSVVRCAYASQQSLSPLYQAQAPGQTLLLQPPPVYTPEVLASVPIMGSTPVMVAWSPVGVQTLAAARQPHRKYPQPRGKRGGKRVSKRRQATDAWVHSGIEA